MPVNRVVPNLTTTDPQATAAFYTAVVGLTPVMDHGWITTVADPDRPELQVSLISADATAPVNPAASIEVTDIDAAYTAALATGAEIVHPLTNEPWGVRRFFVRDPGGNVVNILAHGTD
ncbi:VOC family protein [Actinokineospora inagensis]|uniref:VOC family protein n=1 Tax=Actinokineospora inagensis TaxID=103730 RepID=UPI0003F79D3F|nr:VOC family protein [Actinokineospora inagensis]